MYTLLDDPSTSVELAAGGEAGRSRPLLEGNDASATAAGVVV
jgi:hypothetical protein